MWERETRKNYNDLQNSKAPKNPTSLAQGMTWDDWNVALDPGGTSPYVPRLVVDYFRTGNMSADLLDQLKAVWAAMGYPYGGFQAWLSAMKEAWTESPSY